MRERAYTLSEGATLFESARSRVVTARVQVRRFSGQTSRAFEQEAHVFRDVASVLPYDPREDRVALVEQFRFAPAVLGDDPWLIEQVAGRLDAGETPESAACREALEEAGCALTALRHVMNLHPAPGGLAQRWTLFVGCVSAMPESGSLHGLDDENEELRVHVLTLDQALTWLDEGRIREAATAITLQWAARHREALRQAWA